MGSCTLYYSSSKIGADSCVLEKCATFCISVSLTEINSRQLRKIYQTEKRLDHSRFIANNIPLPKPCIAQTSTMRYPTSGSILSIAIIALCRDIIVNAQRRDPLDRPNLVLFFVDDLGYGDCGFTGSFLVFSLLLFVTICSQPCPKILSLFLLVFRGQNF